jgi:5'-nucleotidase (lipoprotein e(P4) family)
VLNEVFGGGTTWAGMPDGLHWVRSSAEYRALACQIYAAAGKELRARRDSGRLPQAGTWAVALDADETVLDNSLYTKEQLGVYAPDTWAAWVARGEAGAVPGAREFLASVRELGGKIAIVSNRRVETRTATAENLRALGLPFDLLLLQDDDPEKEPRWESVESGTAAPGVGPLPILMYMGDSITDFPLLHQEVRRRPADFFSRFGTDYFVLPNPVYGSWESVARE